MKVGNIVRLHNASPPDARLIGIIVQEDEINDLLGRRLFYSVLWATGIMGYFPKRHWAARHDTFIVIQ